MQTYTSNILVSNTYFYTKRRELETLTNQEDPCTVVYTLSAVENHWVDLHRLLYRKFSLPNISHPIKNIWWKRNTSCRFRHMWIQFSVSAQIIYLILFLQMQDPAASGDGIDVSTKREVQYIFTDVFVQSVIQILSSPLKQFKRLV